MPHYEPGQGGLRNVATFDLLGFFPGRLASILTQLEASKVPPQVRQAIFDFVTAGTVNVPAGSSRAEWRVVYCVDTTEMLVQYRYSMQTWDTVLYPWKEVTRW